MADYGQSDTSTTSLGVNQFPINEVYVPNDALRALEGVAVSTDSGGKKSASALFSDIERPGYIALTSPPATTNAGSDTALTFSSQVNRVIIQNNTSANVNFAFDTAASAGALLLVPGAMLVYPKKCTVLHLYTAAAQAINGTAAGGIVVLGAS